MHDNKNVYQYLDKYRIWSVYFVIITFYNSVLIYIGCIFFFFLMNSIVINENMRCYFWKNRFLFFAITLKKIIVKTWNFHLILKLVITRRVATIFELMVILYTKIIFKFLLPIILCSRSFKFFFFSYLWKLMVNFSQFLLFPCTFCLPLT